MDTKEKKEIVITGTKVAIFACVLAVVAVIVLVVTNIIGITDTSWAFIGLLALAPIVNIIILKYIK